MDSLSASPLKIQFCREYGSKMQHLETIFFCYGGDRGWNIVLPVCPRCEDLRSLKILPFGAA